MRLFPDEALVVATIWQESRGEFFLGKLAVAEVIRNRMRRRYSSDGTIEGTVLRPWQFSGWNQGDPNRIPSFRLDDMDPIVLACKRAWKTATLENTNTVKGAVLYFNPSIVARPAWAAPDKAARVAVVGSHHFFVPKV